MENYTNKNPNYESKTQIHHQPMSADGRKAFRAKHHQVHLPSEEEDLEQEPMQHLLSPSKNLCELPCFKPITIPVHIISATQAEPQPVSSTAPLEQATAEIQSQDGLSSSMAEELLNSLSENDFLTQNKEDLKNAQQLDSTVASDAPINIDISRKDWSSW